MAEIFSEEALVGNRVKIEIKYLQALTKKLGIETPDIKIEADFARIKEIEKETKHDVKAVEYYIREKLKAQGLTHLIPWVHFGITSEDVNNLAQGLMLKAGSVKMLDEAKRMQTELVRLVKDGQDAVMVGRTHGQPAVPTTMGKELLVYELQLRELWEELKNRLIWSLG